MPMCPKKQIECKAFSIEEKKCSLTIRSFEKKNIIIGKTKQTTWIIK